MLQRSLGIGMPEVTLHILDASVVLHVRGRRAPECLMGQILDPNLLRQRFQTPLQIVANAERRSGRIWKEERARIIAFWVPRNPRFNLASEIGRHWHVVVALLCLCGADPILAFLALLEGFVDTKLRPLVIFNPQYEDLCWPQAADGEDP